MGRTLALAFLIRGAAMGGRVTASDDAASIYNTWVKYTIKNGIVYDATRLLADVAAMVEKQKQERATTASRRD